MYIFWRGRSDRLPGWILRELAPDSCVDVVRMASDFAMIGVLGRWIGLRGVVAGSQAGARLSCNVRMGGGARARGRGSTRTEAVFEELGGFQLLGFVPGTKSFWTIRVHVELHSSSTKYGRL